MPIYLKLHRVLPIFYLKSKYTFFFLLLLSILDIIKPYYLIILLWFLYIYTAIIIIDHKYSKSLDFPSSYPWPLALLATSESFLLIRPTPPHPTAAFQSANRFCLHHDHQLSDLDTDVRRTMAW